MKLLKSFLAFFAITIFFSSINCFAQNNKLNTVDRQLDSIEVAKYKVYFKTENEIQNNWSKLHKGMNSIEVIKLLGNPVHESYSVDLSLWIWKYQRGQLIFNGVSKTLSKWDK